MCSLRGGPEKKGAGNITECSAIIRKNPVTTATCYGPSSPEAGMERNQKGPEKMQKKDRRVKGRKTNWKEELRGITALY